MKIGKTLTGAVLGIAFATCVQAQTCSLVQMASLDMTILPDGRVTVPVTINGVSQSLVVNTASMYSGIPIDTAQSLGLKQARRYAEMYGVGGGGPETVTTATVESLKVGPVEAKNFHLVAAGQKARWPKGVDGTVGPDILASFDVEFDFSGRKLNLFSQDHCRNKVVYWTKGGYAEIPFHLTGDQQIRFDMTLDGHRVSTNFETGSANTWLRRKDAYQIFGISDDSPGVTASPFAAKDWPVLRKRFGSLELGGLAVQNPEIDVLPDKELDAFRMEHSEKSRDDPIYGSSLDLSELALGMNVIGKVHTYIAYKEHKLYITAADAR